MRKKRLIDYKWQISLMTVVLFCLTLIPFPNSIISVAAETTQKVKIKFNKDDGDYWNWDIWAWW